MNWKKTIIILADTVIAVYLIFAITAFNKPVAKNDVCNEVNINIRDNILDGFLNANEIKDILNHNKIYPLARNMQNIDTREIENVLAQSPFVETAQCYKTQSGHVCIEITQRMPVIRVKATNGDDYYIDNHGGILPNTRYTSDIIIATGYINKWYAKRFLTRIGKYIAQDSFWQNMIVQLNVLPDHSIELVPRVGEHIVYLGSPTNIQRKLTRLKKFYKYGLSQAGWNKYDYINLEFDNQIICKKKQNII